MQETQEKEIFYYTEKITDIYKNFCIVRYD